ncbi:MAG: porin family protein [Bacteroidota bacterium]
MKRVISFSAFIFLAGITFAQFTVGPKVGFTMSKLVTNLEDVTEEVKTGFQFGAFARFGDKIYVQPELMYVAKGGIIKEDLTNYKVHLSTIQIPALVGYNLLNLGVANIHLVGGPAISFITNKEVTLSGTALGDAVKDKNIKNGIWSLHMGAGIDVMMFTLDIRYEMGLNNMWDPLDGAVYDMKNNLWNISLGWKIL